MENHHLSRKLAIYGHFQWIAMLVYQRVVFGWLIMENPSIIYLGKLNNNWITWIVRPCWDCFHLTNHHLWMTVPLKPSFSWDFQIIKSTVRFTQIYGWFGGYPISQRKGPACTVCKDALDGLGILTQPEFCRGSCFLFNGNRYDKHNKNGWHICICIYIYIRYMHTYISWHICIYTLDI